MTEPTPATPDQARKDERSLQLLGRLHFAMALLCAVGIVFLVWHYLRMHNAFLDISPSRGRKGLSPAMGQFLEVFKWYYLASGAALLVVGAANLVSGRLIQRRRLLAVSLLVACLNCAVVPVGTALAAFTLVVLLRDSVRGAYAAGPGAPAAPRPAGG
jgi:hypothetical protein